MRIFSAGLPTAPREELDDLLIAMQVLRPDDPQVLMCEARMLIRFQDWIGAVRILKQLEGGNIVDKSLIFSLLAGCLYQIGDSEWCRYAADLLQFSAGPAALILLSRFLRHSDRAARVMPERIFINYFHARVEERASTN